MESPADITQLLVRWCEGDRDALESLLPLVEAKLRELARYHMRREGPGHLLQTTALVNEAFLRLIDQNRVHWQNRAHFFGISARIMRRILLNHARDQKREKRGGGAMQVSLSKADEVATNASEELIALDEALTRLERIDERKCRVVELRFFGGLSVEETAEVLGVSPVTVIRDWTMARAWLAREVSHDR
ncbi:MAG: sigma-70 family RNA polymerase sigma factor [Blastocatellia bacterium]|nr:sigma-70 family RNA polymerase sigma factor [Blastocatellia bacterium]